MMLTWLAAATLLLAADPAAVRQTIAHRGSSIDRPENTLAAFRRAIESGVSATEVDVRSTKDGALVCLHDADLKRSTNGSGKVNDKTLAEIQQLDAGTWFAAEYKDERVPTLAEVLQLCKGKVDVLLDLKEDGPEYVARVVAVVRKHGEPKEIIVGVRTADQAKQFRKLLPEARQLGLIPKPDAIAAFAAAGVETIRLWPYWLEHVPTVRQHKVGLHLAVEKGTLEEVRKALEHAPTSLSSDDPARLMESLKALRKR